MERYDDTFAQEFGFPNDEEWMKSRASEVAEFINNHKEAMMGLAQVYLLGEGLQEPNFIKIIQFVNENRLHQTLFDLLGFFVQLGYFRGKLDAEDTVDNTERDSSLKNLLREVNLEGKEEQNGLSD